MTGRSPPRVALLAGGTGGAKLARGMLDVVGPERLSVIANTADDVEVYGVHVSPDPDLVTFRLADLIDERGWGLAGDTWEAMAAFEAAGRETWFRLGDRDLALCLARTELLRAGATLTEAHAAVVRGLGVGAAVLPMADEPVRTHVLSGGEWRSFQEFMILGGGATIDAPVAVRPAGTEPEALPDDRPAAIIEELDLRGVEAARPTPEVLAAIESADAIVIGPSNPVISIGPILAVPGMRDALASAAARVVAVSPFVDGHAVKGPTEAFCAAAGLPAGAPAVVAAYGDLLDGLVADEELPGREVPTLVTGTLMDAPAARAQVAASTLDFAASLEA